MILLTNFSGITQNITFNQAGGTGSTNCGILSSNSSSICAGSSATIVANNSTGLSSPSYSLNPGGLTSPTPTFIVAPTITTNYTVYVTGTSSAVVTQTALSTVTVQPLPLISPTFTQVTCTNTLNAVNLNLTFNPSSAAPTYTVLWSPTPSTVSASQTVGTGLSPGVTSVTVTAAGGCIATTNFTMINVTTPTLALTNNTGSFSLTCTNPTINLCAATNYTAGTANFFWINSISTFSSNLTCVDLTGNSSIGNYTVSITDPATN
jgi:hypothetical protein